MGTRYEVCVDDNGNEKIDKPPYCIEGDRAYKADKTNPENHCTFSEAVSALERGVVDAIGFVFSESDLFSVVDLDKVVRGGKIHRAAAKIVADFETYWEKSCSGTGLH